MKNSQKELETHGLSYRIRDAEEQDAKKLSIIRMQIDGETENMDREQGEAYIDENGFRQLIKEDTEKARNLFLVAEVDGEIAGFSRCEGFKLKRMAHKAEFGICILKEFWGFGIGKSLLKETVEWADGNGIEKISLAVLETNQQAISLYKKFGFEVEGILKKDKVLADGKYYSTILMGRFIGQ